MSALAEMRGRCRLGCRPSEPTRHALGCAPVWRHWRTGADFRRL